MKRRLFTFSKGLVQITNLDAVFFPGKNEKMNEVWDNKLLEKKDICKELNRV